MILKALLQLVLGLLSTLLTPLSLGINFIVGLDWVEKIIKIGVYILPWRYLTPLISFIIGMFIFRAIISIIKTIWELIPIM